MTDEDAKLRMLRDVAVAMVRCEISELTLRQLAVVLSCFLHQYPLTVCDLAEVIDIQQPAVTRALDTLHKARIVERRPNPEHSGSSIAVLTPQGFQLIESLRKVITKEG